MKQGDIILVPFPFSDLSSQKVRPALVVSSKPIGSDVLICAITSHDKNNTITLTNKDLSEGELPITSYIKYMKLVTIDTKIIHKKVGKISEKKIQKVLSEIKKFL